MADAMDATFLKYYVKNKSKIKAEVRKRMQCSVATTKSLYSNEKECDVTVDSK